MLKELTKQIVESQDTLLQGDVQVAKSTLDAVANILTASHDIINLDENGGIATSDGPQRYETMDTETFEALA